MRSPVSPKASSPASRRVAASSVSASGKTHLPSPPLSPSRSVASHPVSPKVSSPSGLPPTPRSSVFEESKLEPEEAYDELAPHEYYNPGSYESPPFFDGPVNTTKTLAEELAEWGEQIDGPDDEDLDFPGAKGVPTQPSLSPVSVSSTKDRVVSPKQKPKASVWKPSDISPFQQQAPSSPVASPLVTPSRPISLFYFTATRDEVNDSDNDSAYASARDEANKSEDEDVVAEISRNNFNYIIPTASKPKPQYFTASHTRPKPEASKPTKSPIEVVEKVSSPTESINAATKEAGPILNAQKVSNPTESVKKVATKKEEEPVFDDHGKQLTGAAAYYARQDAKMASSPPPSTTNQETPYTRYSYVAGGKVSPADKVVSEETGLTNQPVTVETSNPEPELEYLYEKQMMSAVTPDATRSWDDMGKDSTDYFSPKPVSPNAGSPLIEDDPDWDMTFLAEVSINSLSS
jgi:hypothetical protein